MEEKKNISGSDAKKNDVRNNRRRRSNRRPSGAAPAHKAAETSVAVSSPHDNGKQEKKNRQRNFDAGQNKPRSNRPARGGAGRSGRRGRDFVDDADIKLRHNDYETNYEADEELMDERLGELHEGDEGEIGAVIGRNAVRELLKSDRSIDKIFVRRGDREGSIVVLVAEAVNRGVPVIEVEKAKLDSLSGFAPHQGIIAMAAAKEYCSVEDILDIAAARGEKPLIVVADGIVDPYNLGALIRCAEGVGAHGLIIPKRRAVGLTPLVTKASAGAIEHLAIAKVPNIGQTLAWLKKKGVWTYAAEAGGKSYHDTDFRGPAAIVFGSEGGGVSSMILEKCDFVTSIPMYGQVNSFNVSTAAAVILSEAARQQRAD